MTDRLAAYRDDGPFVRALARRPRSDRRPRLAWAVPPLLRLLEYGVAAWLAFVAGGGAGPAVFTFLAVVAFHHYDVIYRLQHRGAGPTPWVTLAGLGWEGRMLVVAVGAAFGVLAPVAWGLAAVLAPVFVVDSLRAWRGPTADVS